MVGEVTAVFMETSEWMGYNRSDRFLDQAFAIELYCKKKLESHPDNHVGIFATGLTGYGSVVEPTQDLSKIMNGILRFTLVGGTTNLTIPLSLARFRCFNLKTERKKRNLLKRIVVFAGGPVDPFQYRAVEIGGMLSAEGIALDVVNYGPQQEHKSLLLKQFVEIVKDEMNGSGRILNLQDRLYKYDILPLVEGGNFDRKRRRDDNDDTRGDGRKRVKKVV